MTLLIVTVSLITLLTTIAGIVFIVRVVRSSGRDGVSDSVMVNKIISEAPYFQVGVLVRRRQAETSDTRDPKRARA